MQLAGQDGDKKVWGPPRDIPGAIAVLREAVASGVNHIDTSDFYGPHVTNQIIKQALHPLPPTISTSALSSPMPAPEIRARS
jgi:aryl-alcohol dehydrogenase-like predicted oxidoreductase